MWRLHLQVRVRHLHSSGCTLSCRVRRRKPAVDHFPVQILEQPITTPRIVKSIDYVLELCSEASAMRMSIMLIWPLLIAGVHCSLEVRPKVRSLFDAFQSEYCEDLQVAVSLSRSGALPPSRRLIHVRWVHSACCSKNSGDGSTRGRGSEGGRRSCGSWI